MTLTSSRYVIAVPDFGVSIPFYRDVLGFKVIEIGDPGWRFYQKDAVLIMAGECRDAIPPQDLGDHSYFAYFEVDEIDTYYEDVKAKGAEIIKPLRDEPWGQREFGLRTADGHRIMVGMQID